MPNLGTVERSFAGPGRSGRSAEAGEIFAELRDSRAKLRWPWPERAKRGGKRDLCPRLEDRERSFAGHRRSRRSAQAKRLYAQEPCGKAA
ncbi:hypothetical protein ACFQ3J_17515 [Paenibacillus provencensis]|uniref:Uncharacterized protein n=1 Tax=Paenibacillus provencensis TaxID=441151 RepID=A0ABW3PVX1_9BACL|nr:hypothetical protein [Paenibacillus sp. MER 78]